MKIKKRSDVDPKEGKDKYGDVKFADPTNSKYPINDEEHIRAAWNYINKEHNASEYSSSEVAQIKRRIIAAWKEKIDKDGPPSAAQSANASYAFAFSGDALPESIMYMPAGKSTILPTVNGEPKEISVNVDASTAETLQDALEDLLEHNVEPSVDFDHKGQAAAAWPKAFRWVEGKGVFLDLDWTQSGKKAVEGKDYRYFSPSFLVGDDGKPLGLPETGPIGALTNNPAFREIQRIAASRTTKAEQDSGDDAGNKTNMSQLKSELVKLGLITQDDADGDEDAVIPKLRKKIKAMTDDADSARAKAKMADEEKEEAKAQLAELQKSSAETVVMAAIAQGKIAPKDDAIKQFYVDSFIRDPKATAAVIESMQPNPAFKRVVAVDGHDRKDQTGKASAATDGTGEVNHDRVNAQRVVLASVRKANPEASVDDIFVMAAAERPDLFPSDD